MAHLFGKSWTRQELLPYVGDVAQLARVRAAELSDGPERGVRVLDVATGSGFAFTVLADRGLDVSSASYCGRSLAWRSATGDTHPAYFDSESEGGRGWLRSFYGGLVVTCGLSWAGADAVEGGIRHGLHGRVSNIPATDVSHTGSWDGDDYVLEIRGTVRETTVFGECLELRRTISTRLGATHLTIHDTVRNSGYRPAPHMMLYHVNIGFPCVAGTARLVSTSTAAKPRDQDAARGLDHCSEFQPPESGFREQAYFHTMATDDEGYAFAAVVNPAVEPCELSSEPGIGAYCRYRTAALPRFTEWKMMDAGTYVVGLEPANCSVLGRPAEREAGSLRILEPAEEVHYEVVVGALVGATAIEAATDACNRTRLTTQQRT